jgi:hypothetical protein
MSRRQYSPESNESIIDRFGFDYDFLAGPEEVSKVCNITYEKFREAEASGLVIATEDKRQAKAVLFSALDEPEVKGWLEFTTDESGKTYRVKVEHEEAVLTETYGGMIGIKSTTYDIAGLTEPLKIEVVGFQPCLVDTDRDREYGAAALQHKKDPFGVGEEATAYFVESDEQGLRRLSLNALHGILVDVNKGEPTLEIKDLQSALKLLTGMAIVTTPMTRSLYLDIKFCEPVRPDVDHRISE